MSKSSSYCHFASIVVLLQCSAILLTAGSAVRAELVTYQLIPFTGSDYFDGTYTDTIGGTITAQTGTYTNASTTDYLEAVLQMTSSKDGSSTTISDTYSGYSLANFVRSGTAYFEADGIYLTKADTNLYLNRAHNWGDPAVSFEWYAPGNRIIAWAGYQGPGATMKIDDSNAGAVYDNGARWKIANAPEPATLVLLLLGLPGIAVASWKSQKRRHP
jgi:hypothetical protein